SPFHLLGKDAPSGRHFFECPLDQWVFCFRRAPLGFGRFLSAHLRPGRHGRRTLESRSSSNSANYAQATVLVGAAVQEAGRPGGSGLLLFAFLHDDQCQPTYATRCWASASAAVLGCVGSVRTVAFCPSQSRVSKTISPSGNSSAS